MTISFFIEYYIFSQVKVNILNSSYTKKDFCPRFTFMQNKSKKSGVPREKGTSGFFGKSQDFCPRFTFIFIHCEASSKRQKNNKSLSD